ncbi:TPA: hypothetical protein N0F65_000288 [Lagenidium giganteum]|uniref:Uncharacterized protein n=1 Tax=Lagenidium giganteum TaxID=4803 RepID=A0AAV2Z6V5_9STRA|nr:TPA: hypothetical protein N0F65_000288 [Lagenidium giganteum]
MTVERAMPSSNAEVDYFSLHNRKKREIHVEMLDYGFVEKCSDLDELKGILALLRSGKEGRYPQLEKATEDRILAVLPPNERQRIMRMRVTPSSKELLNEKEQLCAWTQEIDAKSLTISKARPATRKLPPVRGSATEVTVIAKEKTRNQDPMKSERQNQPAPIPAYDFRAWEKYDVNKALAEIDEEEQQRQEQARLQREQIKRREAERKKEIASLPAYVNLDELSSEEKEVCALYEKQKGNECFKVGENEDAILYYTRSLAFDDTNAVVYSNRAMAYLRTKSFVAAENDCSRAISLDPIYVKAWVRRGMTRFRRGKYETAVADFKEALRLDPNNREVEKLLKKTQEKWQEVDGTVGESEAKSSEPSESSEPTQTKFKRMEIAQDTSSDEDDDDDDDDHQNQADNDVPRFEILED